MPRPALAHSAADLMCASLASGQHEEATVDLTVKLNMLAVCAAFAFVGAILLGAF